MYKNNCILVVLFLILPIQYVTANAFCHGNDTLGQSLFKWDTTMINMRLDEIVVKANKLPREIIPVQVMNGKMLEKLNANSVADALRYFSGVQIKDYGGIGGLKTVNIRSMGSQHVGVFYDGIDVGNAQNGVVDLGRFSLDNMEAISLYNGQKSAIFQPAKDYASASSIYMYTKEPVFRKGKSNNLNAGFKTGSFGTANPSILWEHQFNDKVKLSASTEYMYTTGRYKFSYAKKNGYDTTEVRKNGDVKLLRAEAAIFGKLNKGEWKAKTYFYKSERGYPGASVREEPGKFKHQDRQWDDNLFIQGSLKKVISSWYSLMVNAKYAYDYLHYLSDPRADVTTMYVNNHYTQQTCYISTANMFYLKDWLSTSISADYQYNTLDADLVDFVYPKRHSIYIAAALSVDLKKFKFQTSLLNTYIHDITHTKGTQAKDKNMLTPSFIASYKPFSDINLNIRSFYKRIFRMPTFNDLYYTFIGNKDLKPEYTTQYDIGLTYALNCHGNVFKSLEFQVDGYYNRVEDKIIAMPTSNQFRWTMINLGIVKIKGVDAAIQNNMNFGNVEATLRLNYTYQKAQDFTDKTSEWYGGQIPYIPWHSGSVIGGISYKNWYLSYSYIYTGERYEAVANIPENYALPWYTHDLSISNTFHVGNFNLKMTGEINNIFNQQYEVVQCYPMPGRNFKIKLNFIL